MLSSYLQRGKMGKIEKEECTSNGVIVTVYEESPTVGGSQYGKEKIRARNSKPRKSCGYDRRAELLAYSHHLRNAGSQQFDLDQSPTNSMPKPKKRRKWLGPLRKLQVPLGRIFGGKKRAWRYECIDSQGCMRKHRSRRQGRSKWSKMSQRLRLFLKDFSSGWKCNRRP